MPKVSPKIPDECPLLSKCSRQIDELDFEQHCSKQYWVFCPFAKEEARQYQPKATPCEWKVARKIKGDNEDGT